jgi:hypothetical protein
MAFSDWRSRFSPSRPDRIHPLVLVAVAATIGVVGWSGNPLTLPLAMLFPALWAFSPSRTTAALVSAGYFLGASRGLPQGVANFYGSDLGPGIGLWVAASLIFVLVHAVLWTSRPGWGRALRYAIAAVLMSVPPFGIVGWAHPITAAGVLFPAWGWMGLGAAAIGLLAVTTRFWPIAILILGGLWICSAATWTGPIVPVGWVGVDTQFRGANGQYAGYEQQRATIARVLAAVDAGANVVVLPESAAGIWTPTVERLWTDALRDRDVVVNAGAVIVDHGGYDNLMMAISSVGGEVLYRERMPVPVSMWQPWLALVGEGGGARADFFANPIVGFGGRRVAPLICYEQLLVWPVLQSMLHSPEVIVATGNGWWTAGISIVAIQKSSAEAWARLFDLPLVTAFNT